MKSLLVGMMLASTLNAAPTRTVTLVGTVHSEDIGNQTSSRATWLPSQPKRIEQFEFHLKRPMKAVQLEYQCHLQDVGDSGWLPEGTPCGTQGEWTPPGGLRHPAARRGGAPVHRALLVPGGGHGAPHGPAHGRRGGVRHHG